MAKKTKEVEQPTDPIGEVNNEAPGDEIIDTPAPVTQTGYAHYEEPECPTQ